MHTKRGMRRLRSTKALVGAVGTIAAAMCATFGCAGGASGAAIDVALADESTTTTTTNSVNQGINPVTYTPPTSTIPYATSVTYDAADKSDAGTTWNSIQGISTAPPTANPSATAQLAVLYEQNLPVVDSTGATTSVLMNISVLEGPGKADSIHPNGSNAGTAGTDGLVPNPASSTSLTGGLVDGYAGTGASHKELMNPAWISNGVTDGFLFTLTGLTPNGVYNLFVYGAGSAVGQGGTFTQTDALGNPLGGPSVTTNSVATAWNRSVFGTPSGTGNDPAPEKGLSWNEIQATADATGSLSFSENNSGDTIKSSINGFQLDAVVPEPTSLGLLALGGFGLLGRRRPKAM